MNDLPVSQPAPLYELRVLDGEQRGARAALRPGVTLNVGAPWTSDVVLRSAAGAVALTLREHGLEVRACSPGVRVGARALAEGETAPTPLYAPITLGEIGIAVGTAGARRWEPLFDAGAAASAAETAEPRRRWARRLFAGGAAVAAASLSMLALAVVIAPAPPGPEQLAHRAEALLRSAGLTAVSVRAGSGGELVVSGYLDTHAERSRAEQLLGAEGLRPRMAVWVNESVAQAVQDVYRVNGIVAEAQASGPGAVSVRTAQADVDALTRIERVVRRDVQGLTRLDVHNAPPPHTPSPVPAIEDPGKRVAAIVAGADPYVVTQDGTRYFVGAMLPTGHRILGIDASRVSLEREGQPMALVF